MPPKKDETLERWRRLLSPLEAHAAEVPHLATVRGKLKETLTRAEEIVRRQAALEAERQALTREFGSLREQGDRTAALLRSGLTEHYGSDSERLTAFGMQPFRGRKRKAAPENSSDET
jgi:vacuolar-type H+-ATPase subunit I/STV1